jgi:prevent-host-death family protein
VEVNIYEAKTNLSKLLDRVMVGEEIIIAKSGKPMAKLVRIDAPTKRVLGSAAGSIQYHEGWDAPMTDDELDVFLGAGRKPSRR